MKGKHIAIALLTAVSAGMVLAGCGGPPGMQELNDLAKMAEQYQNDAAKELEKAQQELEQSSSVSSFGTGTALTSSGAGDTSSWTYEVPSGHTVSSENSSAPSSSSSKTETESKSASSSVSSGSSASGSGSSSSSSSRSDSGSKSSSGSQSTASRSTAKSDYYIMPGSDYQYAGEGTLSKMNNWELCLARNEIYARRGRRFKVKEIQAYFDSQEWYDGTISPSDFSESVFNPCEKANVERILDVEKFRNSPYINIPGEHISGGVPGMPGSYSLS